jgi:hypothetical protein
MTLTLEMANDAMRTAVRERLEATPADDPKLVGYKLDQGDPEPESCCEGQRFRGDALLADRKHPSSVAFLELLQEMRRLHESKSADYGSEDDPLANIRQGADFVNIEAWRGCMVRIADKVQRLRTYCRTGRLVHEGVRDTLLDLSAYSLLAIVLFDEGRERDA